MLNIVHKKRIILGEDREGGTMEEQMDWGVGGDRGVRGVGKERSVLLREEVGREKVGN